MSVEITELKKRVKEVAASKNKSLKDIYNHLGISQAAFDKYFHSKNALYSFRLHQIANFLEIPVSELSGESLPGYKVPGEVNNLIEDKAPDLKTLLIENDFLKKIIEKQTSEIEFLRGQLKK